MDVGLEMHDMRVGITGLSPGKTYRLEGVASFVNPQTLREESVVIYEEEVTTLLPYNITVDVVLIDDYLEVTMTVYDPEHYFQVPMYEIYEVSDEYDIYLEGNSYTFTPIGNEKTATFTILIPVDITYRLVISVQNDFEYTIKQIVYDEISE